MDKVFFRTPEEQRIGLIGMKPIPSNTLFYFPGISEGAVFHSTGVSENFDLAFCDASGKCLSVLTMTPPFMTAVAPSGTSIGIESEAGMLRKIFGR
jgi:uncharacterized membrane protein (UPF0127 family)